MKDTLRQINLLPEPTSPEQELLRTFSWRERFAFRTDATRWLLLGTSGCAVVSYLLIVYSDLLVTTTMSLIMRLLSLLG